MFSSEGVRAGGGGRKGTEIKTHTTFFLPWALPPRATLGPSEVPRGRPLCPFLSRFLRPWLPSLAPHLAGPAGKEARLWERKQRDRGAILGGRRLRNGARDRCGPGASPGRRARAGGAARTPGPVGSGAAPPTGAAGREGRGAGDGRPGERQGRPAGPRPAGDRAWREAPGRRKRQHGQEGQAARVSPTAVCSSGGSERVFPGPAVWPPPSQPRETGPDSLGQAGASTQPPPRCLLPWPLAPALSLSGFRSSTLWVSRSSSQKPPRVGCGLVPSSHSHSLSPLSHS